MTHFYCLAVEAGLYSNVVECLTLDPAAQVRFRPWAVGIFLHPVTFCGHCVGFMACVSGIRMECPRILQTLQTLISHTAFHPHIESVLLTKLNHLID